jgi:hypothetical protein
MRHRVLISLAVLLFLMAVVNMAVGNIAVGVSVIAVAILVVAVAASKRGRARDAVKGDTPRD